MIFKCTTCAEKDRRIEYLEALVSRLLLSAGIPDIASYSEEITPNGIVTTDTVKSGKQEEDDKIVFGGDE